MSLAQLRGFSAAVARQTARHERAQFQILLTAHRGDAKSIDAMDRATTKRTEA